MTTLTIAPGGFGTESADGSDDEIAAGEYYEGKGSKKKEKKRQEREAQRQVQEYNMRRKGSKFKYYFP